MLLLNFVDSMCSVAGDTADERNQDHRIEHARPTIVFAYPADHWAFNERAD